MSKIEIIVCEFIFVLLLKVKKSYNETIDVLRYDHLHHQIWKSITL